MRSAILAVVLAACAFSQESTGSVVVVVDSPPTFYKGSTASVRAIAYRPLELFKAEPAQNAPVSVLLDGKEVFRGKTGKSGTVDIVFAVPASESKESVLKVIVGESSVWEQKVAIVEAAKILLTTDKPIYQPEQKMLIRTLTMDNILAKTISGRQITLTIQDPKGNVVFKQTGLTSDYGIFSAEFQLADEVNFGTYRVRAVCGGASAERSAEVKKYVLPKFSVSVKTDAQLYRPLDTVKGTVEAKYFFGKPVANATIRVSAKTFDVQFKEFAAITLKTDEKGKADFEVKLPDYFVGQPLEKGDPYVSFDFSVTDEAQHLEKTSKNIPVSAKSVNVQLIPEGGKIIAGVPLKCYLIVSRADGSPLSTAARVKIGNTEIDVHTDSAGFAVFEPNAAGAEATVTVGDVVTSMKLPFEDQKSYVAIRTDRAIYRQGQDARVQIFSSQQSDVAFVDVVRENQTVLTTTVEIAGGKGEKQIVLPADLFGAVEIHAYSISMAGEIYRDSRLVYLNPANGLKVSVATDGGTHLPGSSTTLKVNIADSNGKPVQGAVGIIIVDEAVYALQENMPGLERVYFAIQEEYMKPRYQIKGCDPKAIFSNVEAAQDEAARMLLSNVALRPRGGAANALKQLWETEKKKPEALAGKVREFMNKNYSQPGKLTTIESSGKRSFKEIVELMLVEKAIAADEAMYSWGKRISFASLASQFPDLQFDNFTENASTIALIDVFDKLYNMCASEDFVEMRNGKAVLVKDIAKAMKNEPVDCWGDKLTTERMQAMSTSFSPEQVLQATVNSRANRIFVYLVAYAKDEQIGDVSDYVKEIIERLAKKHPEASKTFIDPRSATRFTIEILSKEYAPFVFQTMTGNLDAMLGQRLLKAILEYAKSNDFTKFFDTNGIKDAIAAELVKCKLLQGDSLKLYGKSYTVSEIAKQFPNAITAATVTKSFQFAQKGKIYSAVLDYCKQKAAYWDSSNNKAIPPANVLNELIEKKLLTPDDLKDIYGREMKLYVNLTTNINPDCSCVARHLQLRSAGADGKFETSDDMTYPFHESYSPPEIAYTADIIELPEEPDDNPTKGESLENLALYAFKGRGMIDAIGAGGGSGGRYGKAYGGKSSLVSRGGGAGGKYAEIGTIREWFPETLYWNPELITDAAGNANVDLKLADSITTWRVTAMANTKDGKLGSTVSSIVTFKDFFIDIDFPVAITQNDTFSVPIATYNYLKERQKIKVVAQKGEWFEVIGDDAHERKVEPNSVSVVHFKIRATRVGLQSFTVLAYGTKMSDAIKRTVEVAPDGKMFETIVNGTLDSGVSHKINIPQNAIDGSYKIFAKIYPSMIAQAVDSLEALLKVPHG